jgi:hypothetical protein
VLLLDVGEGARLLLHTCEGGWRVGLLLHPGAGRAGSRLLL